MITRDKLIERLQKDYAPDDVLVARIFGFDEVREAIETDVSATGAELDAMARKIWSNSAKDTESAVEFLLESSSADYIYDPVREAIAAMCSRCGEDANNYADVGKGLRECKSCYHKGIEEDTL